MKVILTILYSLMLAMISYADDKPLKIPILYFYEAGCPDCARVNELVMPAIIAQYSDSIEIIGRDVEDIENFEAMMAFEAEYEIPPQEVPEFYTAYGVTFAPDKIGTELPVLIEKQLKKPTGGKYQKFLHNYLTSGKTGISVVDSVRKQYNNQEPTPLSDILSTSPPLRICEFRKPGCRNCTRLDITLNYINKKFPERIIIERHNIKNNSSKILNEAFCIKYDIDEKLHLTAPSLFFGNQALVGEENIKNADMIAMLTEAVQNRVENPTPEITDAELQYAEDVIYQRYTAISWSAVLSAGLLDGINPCAFVTIIFLLSYLSVMKYGRKDIALVGLSFTVAVFLTYLAIGLGFLQLVSSIQKIPYINDILFYSAISLALIFGVMNINDYIRIKRGKLSDMNLKLNDSLRKRINLIIRKNVKLRHYVAGAFLTGVVVSLLELACTGQVYLPTILFIINTQGIEFRALMLLIAYNLAFILPLLIIFVLFWRGSSEKRLSEWLTSNGAGIKLAMGLLFIAFAVVLLFFV